MIAGWWLTGDPGPNPKVITGAQALWIRWSPAVGWAMAWVAPAFLICLVIVFVGELIPDPEAPFMSGDRKNPREGTEEFRREVEHYRQTFKKYMFIGLPSYIYLFLSPLLFGFLIYTRHTHS